MPLSTIFHYIGQIWSLTPLSTIFQLYRGGQFFFLTPLSTIFQLYRGGQFYCFNTTFKNIQLYRRSQLYLRRKPEYPEKTTDLPQVTDTLYHMFFLY